MPRISNERQTEILINAIGWFSDHFEDDELLRILREHLKLSDDELDCFGFEIDEETDLENENFEIQM